MDPERFKKVCELFAKVRELPEAERERVLGEFADDQDLLEEMSGLLAAYADPLNLEPLGIDGPGTLTATPVDGQRPREQWPHHIDGYDILRRLNNGGQGCVYQALQRSTRRKVAIKILHDGAMATRAAKRRFEREIELVAQLRHPNIISVIDSGTTADGAPFFAMEYVRGQAVDDYVRDKKPPLEDALTLFCGVCDAVQYAHHRAIIHRDLKPSNILVDSDGCPRVLDFGLAKWIGGASDSLVSISQDIMGTLPYMSPELARGNPDEIDTRTDVYALGVILFQLLTGHYPYPVTGDMAEVLLHIAQTPPSAPSRCWTPESGITRRTSRITRSAQCPIDDELQTIVLRALAKEQERRYQSAGEFARDIQRYLSGEAIEAKRDSKLYVLRKVLAAYRRGIALTALAVALVSTATFATMNWVDYRHEQQATQLVTSAIPRISRREQLTEARAALRQALTLRPRSPEPHIWLGLAYAFEAFDAPWDQKAAHARDAIAELLIADRGFGGTWPQPQGLSALPGSPLALRIAAQLCLLIGQTEQAQDLLNIAGSTADYDDPVTPELYSDELDRLVATSIPANTPVVDHMIPDRDAELHRYLAAPVESYNPMLTRSVSAHVLELLFDDLFWLNADLELVANDTLVADVAHRHPHVTRVVLRENLTWHDGQPLTSADIKFSWDHTPTGHFRNEHEHVSAVTIVNDTTVDFHHDDTTTLWDLRVPIIPRHRFTALQQDPRFSSTDSAHTALGRDVVGFVGNGPYTLVADAEPEHIVLRRWAAYPGDPPYFRTVVFHLANPDVDTRPRELNNTGTLHVAELTSQQFRWDITGIDYAARIHKFIAPRHSYVYLAWNNRNALFSDRRIRRALTMAMNLDDALAQWLGGIYPHGRGIYVGPAEVDELLTYDPEEAKRQLRGAGCTFANDICYLDGKPFTFTLLVPAGSIETIEVTRALASDLDRIGITAEVQVIQWSDLLASRKAGNYDALVSSVTTTPNYDDAHQRWMSDAEYNDCGYSNVRVDELFMRARTATAEQQLGLYKDINELIYADQPYTFLWVKPRLWAVDRRLRGVKQTPMGILGFYPGPRAWWFPASADSVDP